MNTLIFANTKGGVSKTHLAFHVAKELASSGSKVLCLDLDQQAHLVKLLHSEEKTPLSKIIMQDLPIEDALCGIGKNLWCIYSDITIRNLNGYLLSLNMGREKMILKKVQPILHQFDFVVVDLPPGTDAITLNSYMFPGAQIIVPVTLNHLALDGLEKIENTISDVQEYLNKEVLLHRVVICRDNIEISKHAQACRKLLEDNYADVLCGTTFPHSIHYVNAALKGESILQHLQAKGLEKHMALRESIVGIITSILN